MTQSAMRMNMAGSRPNQQDAQKRSDQQSSQKRSNQQSSTARSANTPSDVIANAASQTKDEKRGVFASMKQAMAPYVEGHSHTVLYGDVYKRQVRGMPSSLPSPPAAHVPNRQITQSDQTLRRIDRKTPARATKKSAAPGSRPMRTASHDAATYRTVANPLLRYCPTRSGK